MKITAFLTSILLAAAIASAQANSSPGQTSTQSPSAQPQSGAATQPLPNPPAAPATGAHRVLQAKSQDEMKAYQDVMAKTDAAQLEAGAGDFAAKYPNSELRAALYIRAMDLYAQANNNEKVIAAGRQAIAYDPTNPIPLAQVASTLAETTRDTDLDKQQRLAEAAKDAQAAIDNLDTGLLIPANADPERVAGAKHSIRMMAYDTLSMVDLSNENYAAAQTNLKNAIEENKDNPEAVLYLRLSVAQDKLKEYPEALDSANKAVQYAKEGTPAQNLAKQQQQRLQQLMAAQGKSAAPMSSPASPPMPGQQPAAPVPGADRPR